VSLIVIFWKGRKEEQLISTFQSSAKEFLTVIKSSKFLLLCVSLFVIYQAIIVSRIAIAPPNVFDAQVYHLPISVNWFQNNQIHLFEDVPVGRFNYATKAPKMLNFWMLAFTHGNIEFIELTQYFGFVLLLLSVFGIVRSFRRSTFWSACAAIFVSFIPILIIETHTLQDHMLLVAFHFSVIKLFFDLRDEKFTDSAHAIIALSVSLGLLLAGKFSAPAHVLSIVAVCGLLFIKDIIKLFSRKTVLYVFAGLVIVCLTGGIWYVFNYINYHSIFGPTHPQAHKENILLTNFMEMPYRLFEFDHRYTPDLINISGYGPFVVTVALPLAIFAFIKALSKFFKSDEQGHKIIALVVSSILLQLFYFSVYLTSYNYRLLSFMAVTLVIVAVVFVSSVKTRVLQTIFLVSAVISMIFSLVTTIDTDYFSKPVLAWHDYLSSYPENRTIVRFDYSSQKYSGDRSFVFIDQFIPVHEPILYITQHEKGYDDVIVAGYYDNNLKRRAIWGGSLEFVYDSGLSGSGKVFTYSQFFNNDGTATAALVPYMRQQGISYLHNNNVFYYVNPVELKPGKEFVQLTKNLYYLRSASN
jgi:hypothetical protein